MSSMRKPVPFDAPIYVVRPMMPPLESYVALLRSVWERRWLTNKGPLHDVLEDALRDYLRVPHLSLTGNGTVSISLACKALGLTGEVITSPFTSPATPNAVHWVGLTPVFADIDPLTLTLDPAAIERAITPRTSAILGVHIYGMPCDVVAIQSIADRHGLRVVYDGAHAFGSELNGESILNFGDASTLSFHATKLYNSAEGGAVVTRDPDVKKAVDLLKSLGIKDEVTVLLPGINARINELQAALGLANLEVLAQEFDGRAKIAAVYRSRMRAWEGVTSFDLPPRVRDNLQYFVIRVDAGRSRVSRDELYERLKPFNVFARRYFYPICSEFAFYADMPSSRPDNLPVALRASREVLCLPFYGTLAPDDAERICDIVEFVMAQ